MITALSAARPSARTTALIGASVGAAALLAGCAPIAGLLDGPTAERVDASGDAPTGELGSYVDGLYTGNGTYTSPNGRENIVVFLTLAGGIVTEVTVTPGANNPTVAFYQGEFVGGIAAEVVGKHIDELDVTRVAGSSLTSGGFREAVAQIRDDARG